MPPDRLQSAFHVVGSHCGPNSLGGSALMQNTFLSRRRFVGAAAAVAAAAASPMAFAPVSRAATAEDVPGDPLTLPDSERAKVVKAWMTGGRAVKAAAADALYGTDADIQTFLLQL
ncbi:hypothetical protein ACFTZM_34680, partial [Streptomyces hydrogenans]|uniref:hypothetical protein n=1 Tax=Streptomyces hydrogenans TaxID=1873719 RepID=UPI003626FBCB